MFDYFVRLGEFHSHATNAQIIVTTFSNSYTCCAVCCPPVVNYRLYDL